MRLRLVYIFCIILCPSSILGQITEPNAKHYSQRDGMHNEVLYNIFTDSKGHIWLSGNSGVTRFDGKTFKSFRNQQLMNVGFLSPVYAFHEDHKGRIWLIGPHSLSYIRGNFLFAHPQNDKLIQKVLDSRTWIQSMLVDNMDHIWFTLATIKTPIDESHPNLNSVYKLTQDSLYCYDISAFPNAISVSPFSKIIPFKDQYLHTGRLAGSMFFDGGMDGSMIPMNDTTFGGLIRNLELLNDSTYFIVSGHEIMLFSEKTIFQYLSDFVPDQVTNYFLDDNGDIWICTRRGAYRAVQGDFNSFKKHRYFPDKLIAGITRDFEGNYWFATTSEGLLMVPHIELMNLYWPAVPIKNKVHDLEVFQNRLWFSTDEPSLGIINKDLDLKIIREFEEKTEIYLKNIEESFLFLHSPAWENWVAFSPNHFRDVENTPALAITVRNITPLADKSYWLATSTGFVRTSLNQDKYSIHSFKDLGMKMDVNNIIPFGEKPSSDSIYILSGEKLYTYLDSTVNPISQEQLGYKPDEFRFYQIGQNQNGKIKFFITRNDVIFHQDDKFTKIDPDELGENDIFMDGAFLNDTTFYLYYYSILEENYGVCFLQMNSSLDDYSFKGKLDMFEYLHARPSEVINYNGYNWLPTTKNGIIFYPDSIENFSPAPSPLISIRQVELPDTQLIYPDHFYLDSDQNQISIELGGIAYRRAKFLKYRYRLCQQDTSWKVTDQSIIQLANLAPGNYTFETQASTDTTNWSEFPASISFSIKPRWTQTMAFLALMIILGLCLLTFLSYQTIRYLSRRNTLKRQVVEMKYQALQNQMSPHFLFNSLNAILYLINSNQKDAAGRYLTDFAGLLQNVLGQSSETFVPLIDEIEGIQQYLQLEKVQIGDGLEVAIEVDENLKVQDLMMPPMLIQPMIENAVRHGIMPAGSGRVAVFVRECGSDFCIIIEDNGIGRKKISRIGRLVRSYSPGSGFKEYT